MAPDTTRDDGMDFLNGGTGPAHAPSNLADAVLCTLAYADVFDFPLYATEVYRYLLRVSASPGEVIEQLEAFCRSGRLLKRDGLYALRGRHDAVARRQERAEVARKLWPEAIRYGRIMASLPFVRMVCVTGALAADNVDPGADLDFLIVTEAERLWLSRLNVVALVRFAARRGVMLCPNYFLSERALVLRERNLFSARELAQMVLIAGRSTYLTMRRLNDWTSTYLPNAAGEPPRSIDPVHPSFQPVRRVAEVLLRTPPGRWLDRWEMNRKIRKLSQRVDYNAEVDLSPDWCKGHFDGHARRIMTSYEERVQSLLGG